MADDSGESLLEAAAAILQPIVRRLLAVGVPFGLLEARLRELVIVVAERDFELEGRRQTDSRISVLTGINRKEIRRIRGRAPSSANPPSFGRNQAASLMSRWREDPRAIDRSGRPKPIPYAGGRGPTFVKLAERVTVDVPARAILDELVRTGAVEVRADGWVVPKSDSYVPKLGGREKLAMLAEDPPDLVETMLRNIFEETADPLLQRRVVYDNIGERGMETLRRRLRKTAETFVRRVDRLLASYDRDRNPKAPGGDRHAAGIGVYYFEDRHAERTARASARANRRGRKEPEK
jgi:hypothetical protein